MKTLGVEVLRGEEVESRHQVHLIAVDTSGQALWRHGDLSRPTFPRSAIKPMQAMLFADVHAPQNDRERRRLSLASSSHWAARLHLDVLRDWHAAEKFHDDDLICGPQTPRDADEQRRLILEDKPVCRLHNNCSGKHTAFLHVCRERGWSAHGYGDFTHPLQVELRRLHSEMSGIDWDRLPWGIDGCGIPTSLVPVENLLRLTTAFAGQVKTDARIQRVVEAVLAYPEMVAGPKGFCTRFMQAARGEWLVKTGAEGNYLGLNLKNGVSFYLKVEDGNSRASEFAVMEMGRRFSESSALRSELEAWQAEPLTNWSGESIGRLRLTP